MRSAFLYEMAWAAAFADEYLRLADAGMRGPAAAAEAAFKADSAERDLRAHDSKPVPGGRWCGDVAHAADGSPPDDRERCAVVNVPLSKLPALVEQYDRLRSGGGACHIALSDGNVEDHHLRMCLGDAIADGDALGEVIMLALLPLSREERVAAVPGAARDPDDA